MMTCMKCGRAVALGQAFCKDCLEDMSHYPVNPSTPVQIPMEQPVQTPKRASRTKKARKPEEQILHLRKFIRFQSFLIIFLLLVIMGLGAYQLKKLYTSSQSFRPGENYISTEISQQSDPTAP